MEELAECADAMMRIISANATVLRELCIFGALLRRLSPELCRQLRQFDVWGSDQSGKLQPLLNNAPFLRSLSLVELTRHDILPLFRQNPHAFPALRHLKIMTTDHGYNREELADVSSFIRHNPLLRRLDFDFPGSERAGILDLLREIASLQHLKAYGMDLRALDEDDYETIAKFFPPTLCAIHLQTCWENLPYTAPEVEHMVSARLLPWYQHLNVYVI